MAKKSHIEELTDRIEASAKPPTPLGKAETTDPMRELGMTLGLGGMRVQLGRIQREIRRLQAKLNDELNEIEVKRLEAFHEVLNTPDLTVSNRYGLLWINPIFHDVIYTGEPL